MQGLDWVTSIIDSGGTMYSRSGSGPSGISHGVTRRTFSQWVDSISVTRSLITGMFAIGSTTIGVVWTPARCSSTASVLVRPAARSAWFWASWIFVLQARVDWPLTLTPQ